MLKIISSSDLWMFLLFQSGLIFTEF